MSTKPPKELLSFLRPYSRTICELAISLRRIVIDELAPCYESIYDAYNAVALGYGPTEALKDGICHVAVYAHHVNLGFNHGATLTDPGNILRGSGKQIRHTTLNNSVDLKRPELRDYLRRARQQAGLLPTRRGSADVFSVVKGNYPVKRR